MNKKLSNDENIKNLKKRKILRWFIITFCFLTIVFAILNLFFDVNIIFALLCFFMVVILNKVRENTKINLNDDLAFVKRELEKSKKNKKRL